MICARYYTPIRQNRDNCGFSICKEYNIIRISSCENMTLGIRLQGPNKLLSNEDIWTIPMEIPCEYNYFCERNKWESINIIIRNKSQNIK